MGLQEASVPSIHLILHSLHSAIHSIRASSRLTLVDAPHSGQRARKRRTVQTSSMAKIDREKTAIATLANSSPPPWKLAPYRVAASPTKIRHLVHRRLYDRQESG
jgi:hypothetical protein